MTQSQTKYSDFLRKIILYLTAHKMFTRVAHSPPNALDVLHLKKNIYI